MITNEYVMAVLCHPLSMRELLYTEKEKQVIILRKLDYDSSIRYFTGEGAMPNLGVSPVKLMFVFGTGDAIVVDTAGDRQELQRRLARDIYIMAHVA
jgi:hypothetical protein